MGKEEEEEEEEEEKEEKEEEGGVVSTHIHSATLPVFGRGPADF